MTSRVVNERCDACRGKGKCRRWVEADGELIKGGWKNCSACNGKGWERVTITATETLYYYYPYQTVFPGTVGIQSTVEIQSLPWTNGLTIYG